MTMVLAIAVGLLVAYLLFHVFFDDWSDFFDCLRLYFTPEIVAVFRGEWGERNWADIKLLVYGGASIGSGFLAYHQFVTMWH